MEYDAIVIGSGQAGVPLATRLARSGKKVLLAERGAEKAGVLKILVAPSTERILGASIVGAEAGELIHVFAALMKAGAPARAIVEMEAVPARCVERRAMTRRETLPKVVPDATLRFYRDAMGLGVAGGSENRGDEQAHLNGVEGAHPRITTLRSERGSGVELLQYLAPADGRSYPADARPNDRVHWRTTLLAPALDAAASAATAAGATVVSRSTADLAGSRLGLSRALLVRDPDGHALLLAEPRSPVAIPGSR
jgi:catechol 2,3-dioxygenase-like lactoylglutathione lyase family enzyme